MKKITIPATEVLSFGGIEMRLANKGISSLQNCEITLSGKITPLCSMILNEFLKDNKMTLPKPKPCANEKILNEINSEENKKLWASMINTYSFFSLQGPVFWKNNFDAFKKNQMNKGTVQDRQIEESDLNGTSLSVKALREIFEKNIDSKENLTFLFESSIPPEFLRNFYTLSDIFKSLTKEKGANPPPAGKTTVLFYNTAFFHAGKEPMFFMQAEKGIELLAPKLNLYLYFSPSETKLIEPYFDYLKNNFIALTKEYETFTKGKTVADLYKKAERNGEDIQKMAEAARKRMLKKLSNELSPEKIIQDTEKRLKDFATSLNLALGITEHGENLVFVIRGKKPGSSTSFDFTIPKRAIVENKDNTAQMIEKELTRMAERMG